MDQTKTNIGETLKYTITVENVGDFALKNYIVTDDLKKADKVSFIEGSLLLDGKPVSKHQGSYNDGIISVNLDIIEPNTKRQIIFDVKVIKGELGEEIVNTVVVSNEDRSQMLTADAKTIIVENTVENPNTGDRKEYNIYIFLFILTTIYLFLGQNNSGKKNK